MNETQQSNIFFMLPIAPDWAQRRASLRPARRMEQRRPRSPSLARRVAHGAAFVVAVTAACISILALGAVLDA